MSVNPLAAGAWPPSRAGRWKYQLTPLHKHNKGRPWKQRRFLSLLALWSIDILSRSGEKKLLRILEITVGLIAQNADNAFGVEEQYDAIILKWNIG